MLEITIPGFKNENKSIKDLVFSLLAEGVPKTLTQLHKEIRRIYCVSVSFQAVMKAVNALVEKKVLQREKMLYSIDREWIFESRNFLDRLYRIYFNVQEPIKKIELGKEIVVYTLNNLFELDRLWNDLLTNWAKNEQHDKRNAWKGRHCWWLIPRLQEEDILHDLFTKCEIKTYNLIFENTLLDKAALNYYRNKHENVKINKKLLIEKDSHISAFGDFLLKFEIPKNISKRLEYIYKTTTKIESLNLKEVLDIFKENQSIEVTVIKDKMLADKIKEEIIDKF